MTEQLRQRLQEVAEPVQPPPDLAALAWAGAARRRRRRLTAGLAVVACVAAIGLVAVGDPASLGVRLPQVGRGTDGAATAGPGEGILMAPSRSGEATLPWARTGLPRRIDLDPSHAVPLSTSPVRRAVALVERADEHGFAAGPVLALGDDGRMRRLDSYSLSRSRNATGRTLGVLKDTSLSPDGRFAAFPDGLGPVVVNLTDGSERRYRLDFSTWDWVRWHPDSRRLLVGDGVDTYLVDTRDGAVRRVASREAGMAFSATGTEAWELQSQPAAVVRWRGEKVAADRPVRAAIAGWCGSAWVRGGLVARSGSGSPAMHVPG